MPPRPIHPLLGLCLLLSGPACADPVDDALNQIEAYSEAIEALVQNKNEVAALNLRGIDTSELAPPAKIRLLTRLAEAEIRAGNFDAALGLYAEPGLSSDPQASYWQAIALIKSERAGAVGEAETILAGITKQQDHPHWPEATLTRTSLLLRIGAPEDAIKILTPLIESGRDPFASRARLRAAEIRLLQKQWDDVAALLDDSRSADALPGAQLNYLQARLSLGREDWPTALAQLQQLNRPESLAALPPSMRDGAVLGLAIALVENGQEGEATAILYSFINNHPESKNLSVAFDTLDQIGIFKTNTIDERLVNWANSSDRNLASLATYFLAVAQTTAVNEDAAATTLEAIRSNFKDQPIAARALLQLSEIYVANANKPQAIAVLEDLKSVSANPAVVSRIDFIKARADYAAGEFKLAADRFAIAATSDPSASAIATFNSAIAALKADDLEAYNQRTQLLNDLGATVVGADLQLERALFSARQKSPRAGELLEGFLADHPQHPRRAEAHLALAYLQLNLNFPVSARKHLAAARAASPDGALVEEADYISFWIEIGDHQNAEAIAAGGYFVKTHPASARAPEILFKLGGIHFRDGSFTTAQTLFERLALEYPSSPRAEIALFTAGRAAMRTGTPASIDRAINIFSQVAELGGKFAQSAKLQKALVRRTQLDEEEAIRILDSLLAENPTGELLFSTLITKGESLFVLGEKDPASLEEAIAVFDAVSSHPEVTTYWLNQSLTRKGNSLERAGRIDEALAAYEKVIRRPRKPLEEDENPEYVWFYKAGFAAIRIYEERKNWQAAISTAELLAATDGPGAQAARKRSEQLETKNFIWRD